MKFPIVSKYHQIVLLPILQVYVRPVHLDIKWLLMEHAFFYLLVVPLLKETTLVLIVLQAGYLTPKWTVSNYQLAALQELLMDLAQVVFQDMLKFQVVLAYGFLLIVT